MDEMQPWFRSWAGVLVPKITRGETSRKFDVMGVYKRVGIYGHYNNQQNNHVHHLLNNHHSKYPITTFFRLEILRFRLLSCPCIRRLKNSKNISKHCALRGRHVLPWSQVTFFPASERSWYAGCFWNLHQRISWISYRYDSWFSYNPSWYQ